MDNSASSTVDDFIARNVHPSFQKNVKEAFGNDAKVTVLEKNTVVYRYHGRISSGKVIGTHHTKLIIRQLI